MARRRGSGGSGGGYIVLLLGIVAIGWYAYKQGITLDQIINYISNLLGPLGLSPPASPTTPTTPTTPTGSGNFAAVGDIDQKKETTTAMAAEAANIFILGDMDYGASGGAQAWWDDIGAPLHSKNVFAEQGNHDGGDYATVIPGNQGSYDLTVTIGPLRFIGVNTEGVNETFVQDAVTQADTDANIKMIIPFMHMPVQGPPSTHANENTGLHNIFAASKKCLLVLAAHNHNYSRKIVDGITYCTVGIGGHDEGSAGYPVEKDTGTEVAVSGPVGYMVGSYSDSGLNLNVKENSGAAIDSFSINYPA